MRRSFDGLALATQQVMGKNPQAGALYCFVNKKANRLKVLWWDENGYCLLYKRLHRAIFRWPEAQDGEERHAIAIDGRQLATWIAGAEKKRRRKS